jgi:hypothetical protein
LLEEDRAVELGENSALHIDRQSKGFVLTLTEGEVTARIARPLYDGEEFMVKAGGLALSVRGTIFTVRIDDAIVTVSVERSEVAVIDSGGSELTTVGEDESVSFDTSDGNAVVAAPIPGPTVDSQAGDIVGFGGYEWRVLEVSGGKALLLSEYVLEHRPYNEEWVNVTWETCTLRSYLNGEFYDSFSPDDRARMVQTRNSNKDNQWLGTPGGNDTDDYIFLLSLEEVVRYFGDSGQLANRPEGVWEIYDHYNGARIAYSAVETPWGQPAGSASWWWLRSPGRISSSAAGVYFGGNLYVGGCGVGYDYGGVRPALWLNL